MREFVVKIDMEEMPKTCHICKIPYEICGRRMLMWTRDNGSKNGFNSRHPDCPIVAVLPEGHGRLIDWDAFERTGFKLCRKTSEWRAELGTPTNESYVVPAEAERSET